MNGIVTTQQLMRRTSAELLGATEDSGCATSCRDVGKTKQVGSPSTTTNETCMAKENSEPLKHGDDGDGHVKSRKGLQVDESTCNPNRSKAELQQCHYSRASGKSGDVADVGRQRSVSNSYHNGTTISSSCPRRHSSHGLMTEAEKRSPLCAVLLQSVGSHTSGPVEDKIAGRSDDSSERQADPQNKSCPTGEVKKLKPMKLQFWKTKMCPWVSSIGHCRRGGNCRYAHGQEELRPLPDLTKTKMCEDLVTMGKCSNSEFCRFAHSMDELRATTSFSKTKLCQLWLQSSCISGSLCRFAHGEHELRQTEGVERNNSDKSCTSQGDRKVSADNWQQFRGESGMLSNGGREHGQSIDYPSHAAVRGFRERQPHNESRPDRALTQHNHENVLPTTSSRPLRPNSSQQQKQHRHIRHIQSGRQFHGPSAPASPESSGYSHQLQAGHQQHQQHQQQRPILDPTVLFQELSPMSIKVATNALVFLAESQQQQNWSACGNGGLGSNSSMSIPNSVSPSNQVRQSRDLRPSMVSNDSSALAYQASPSQYAQILYPSNLQSPSLWDSTNSSAAGSANHLQQNVQSTMLNQSPTQQQMQQHIVGGTPMQFFAHNMSNGIRPPAGFSPMRLSAAMGQAGTETGRFIATHLLPAGMFSPMGNSGESGQQQRGLQQLCMSPGSTQPVDLFLSFPNSAAADASHSRPSSNPLDFCDQSTVHSDGTGQNLNSPELPLCNVQGGLVPKGFAPKFSEQIRPVQESNLRKPQYVTWNTNSATAPLMYPVDQMARPGQNNNNSRSSSSSPRLFLSAPPTHKAPGALSTFSSPMFRTSPPQQATLLPHSAPVSTTCLSPPSYAMSFTSGISPTSAILRTLNILPQTVSNNGTSYCSSEPPSLDMPLIPGFPNSTFIGSQAAVQQPDLPPTIMSESRLRMVGPAGQSDGCGGGAMRRQMTATETYLHMQQASQYSYNNNPEQQQQEQHHVVQRKDRGPPLCTLEYSPSLLSSKSSSEGTSTTTNGSPLITIETTTAAATQPQPSTQVKKEV